MVQNVKDLLRDKFMLENNDAELLSEFWFQNWNEKDMNKAQLIKFIRSFAGQDAVVRNNQSLEDIINNIVVKNPAEKVNEFISELHTYAVSNIMMPFDFRNIIKTLKLKVDSELLCEKLMCLSLSLCAIKTNVVQTELITPLQDANNYKDEHLLRKSGTLRGIQK
jgi:hypothetical protein